jgi:hypothetical protein
LAQASADYEKEKQHSVRQLPIHVIDQRRYYAMKAF